MERIVGPGCSGKTRKLMHLAFENNGYFICRSPGAMRHKAHAYGIIGLKVLSYEDYNTGNYDTNVPLYMDEPSKSDTELERAGVAGITRTIG